MGGAQGRGDAEIDVAMRLEEGEGGADEVAMRGTELVQKLQRRKRMDSREKGEGG